jgi:hypothetical protein
MLALVACCVSPALLVAADASAGPQGAAPPAGAADAKAVAKQKFEQGKAAFSGKKFDEALKLFQESYQTVPSPNSHLWIVYALTELGKSVESYDEAQRVIAEADEAAAKNPKYSQTAQAARDELQKLKGRVGLLTVQVAGAPGPDVKVSIAGRDIPPEQWGKPLPMMPGTLDVAITGAEGSDTKKIDLKAGAETSVSLEPPKAVSGLGEGAPPPVEEEESSMEHVDLMVPAIVAGGIGVLGLAAFGIFGGLTLGEYSTLEEQCPGNSCPGSRDSDADTGKTYQTVANISLVVGIVGVAAGATMLAVDLATAGDGSEEPSPQSTTPEVAIGPGSIVVSGRF